jgi:hypothetical protein
MVKYDRENSPNAGLFISALRNLGYNNVSAINDMIDNSVDAEATRLVVQVLEHGGTLETRLIDNGYGMSEHTLDQALRLGSEVERNITEELGKFGMGLSTASISIARRLEVLTKQADSDVILKSIQDIDVINKENSFVKYLGEADKEDIELFNQFLDDSDHGTIVRLINCDRLTNKNVGQFTARLIKEMGRSFRDYINAGREFYVNGKNDKNDKNGNKVEAEDIFMLSEGGEIYSDENYEFIANDAEGNEIKETIRVRLGVLPDFGIAGNSERKINSSNQGFYIMRNNREIEKGSTLGFYTRHPLYNRFRGEIYFSANLDEQMGVNFQKNGVDLAQSIHDKILADVKHQISAIGKQIQKGKAAKESSDIDHVASERHINKKAPLLRTPKESEKVMPKDPKDRNGSRGKDKDKRKPRQDVRVRFIAEHHGKVGHIYETRMEGKTAIIAWNIDHPFYERFVVGTKEDKALSTSIDFLIYSLATAELSIMNDQTLDAIEEFKNIMALNLNTLLR